MTSRGAQSKRSRRFSWLSVLACGALAACALNPAPRVAPALSCIEQPTFRRANCLRELPTLRGEPDRCAYYVEGKGWTDPSAIPKTTQVPLWPFEASGMMVQTLLPKYARGEFLYGDVVAASRACLAEMAERIATEEVEAGEVVRRRAQEAAPASSGSSAPVPPP